MLADLQTEAFLEMLGLPYNLDHSTNAQHGSGAATAGLPTANCSLHVCQRQLLAFLAGTAALMSTGRMPGDYGSQYDCPSDTASSQWVASGSFGLKACRSM